MANRYENKDAQKSIGRMNDDLKLEKPALDNAVAKMGYSESLQKSLREKLQERLK